MSDSPATQTPTAWEDFRYGPDGERYYKKSVWQVGTDQHIEHTFYVGSFEEIVPEVGPDLTRIKKTQVTGNVLHVKTTDPLLQVTEAIEYLHRDHLGSVERITDANGLELQVLAYDPFGARRNSDWIGAISPAEFADLLAGLHIRTPRGFTGHEHLDRTGIIHMNGRIYDPQLGRFLSPDPFVPQPTDSQSWNRYSYVLNNPLSYTDPSGYMESYLEWRMGCKNGGIDCAPVPAGIFIDDPNGFYSISVELWQFTGRDSSGNITDITYKNIVTDVRYNPPSGWGQWSDSSSYGDQGTPGQSYPGDLTIAGAAGAQSSGAANRVKERLSREDVGKLEKALTFIKNNIADPKRHPYGAGRCAANVNGGFRNAGIDIKGIAAPGAAKDFGSSYEHAGFNNIDISDGYTPEKYDVVIMQGTDRNPSGHMEIYDGNTWYSDFEQSDFYPSRYYSATQPSFDVYRYDE